MESVDLPSDPKDTHRLLLTEEELAILDTLLKGAMDEGGVSDGLMVLFMKVATAPEIEVRYGILFEHNCNRPRKRWFLHTLLGIKEEEHDLNFGGRIAYVCSACGGVSKMVRPGPSPVELR